MSSTPSLRKRLDAMCHLISYHARTVYLFTEADFKTMFLPVILFVCVIAPTVSLSGMFGLILWTWLHLLQANISNQYDSGEEDLADKPWRPVPSGRLTPHQAYLLYLSIIPACLCLSATYGADVTAASFILTMLLMIYNIFKLRGHLIVRNILNSGGYVFLELGATLVMSRPVPLDNVAITALVCSALVILTTVHAQDFPDVEGDRATGRKTFPIVAPRIARFGMLPLLVTWSVVLSIMWGLDYVWATAIVALSTYVGTRYLRYSGKSQDKTSYRWYNVWLLAVHLMPLSARLAKSQSALSSRFFGYEFASI